MKVTERKAAQYLGIPFWTLKSRRKAGRPLVRYLNVEGRPWYDEVDLDAFLAAETVEVGSRENEV